MAHSGGGWGDTLEVELARRNLEHEASKHNQGFIIRSRLSRVSNEAGKLNAHAGNEELQRFSGWYIDSVISTDGQASFGLGDS